MANIKCNATHLHDQIFSLHGVIHQQLISMMNEEILELCDGVKKENSDTDF